MARYKTRYRFVELPRKSLQADVAQLVEQLIRNQ
jgi:hypothetical protein